MIVYVIYNELLEEDDSNDKVIVAVVDSYEKVREYLKKDVYYKYVMKGVE